MKNYKKIHLFSFLPLLILVSSCGGGGGGGACGSGVTSGGGGAGGYRESSGVASGSYTVSPLGACVSALPALVQNYPITVGAGSAQAGCGNASIK